MVNMFVGACPEDTEIGLPVNVDEDNIDSVDDCAEAWSWWWP
jgi:hypothetical protein